MRKSWNTVMAMWRPVLLGALGLALVAALQFYRLHTLVPDLNAAEVQTLESAKTLSAITDNSVNAPYKTLVYLSNKVVPGVFTLRAISAALAVLTVAIFYLLISRITSSRVAVATTALFASSGLLLHAGRFASADIMLLSLLAIIAVGYLLRFNRRPAASWILATVVIGLSLYVPLMIVFIFFAAVWQFKQVRRSFEELPPLTISLCAALFSVLAAPLVISIVRDSSIWRELLGLPETFQDPVVHAKRAARAALSLFALSPRNPARWLGRQPLLDVLGMAMFVYGLYATARQYKLDRLWMIAGIFLVGFAWIGISGHWPGILLLMPFIYLVIGLGLQHFMDLWLSVFPKNPIARISGLILMSVAVLLAVNFHIQRYFNAWANTEETKAVFTMKYPR